MRSRPVWVVGQAWLLGKERQDRVMELGWWSDMVGGDEMMSR